MTNILLFLVKRLTLSLLAIFIIATCTFVLMKSVPGDPFQDEQGMPQESLAAIRKYYGLEDSLFDQYKKYVISIFSLNFGPSLKYPSQSVNEIILQGFPISCTLGFLALCLAIPAGLLFGTIAAVYKHTIVDTALHAGCVLGLSIPSFVLAALIQFLFAILIPLFPVARWGSPAQAVLPAIALSIGPACMITKLIRASVLDVLQQQYIHTARAKGLSLSRIFFIHVWKNALLPILSYLGPVTANVLVGSFIVERVFGIPGLGQWFVTGVLNRDYSVIGGLTVFYSTILLMVHTMIDLSYALLDPRISLLRRESKEIAVEVRS